MADARCEQTLCDAIELLITPTRKDLGEFSVRRALPVIGRRQVGPWVFFDHMGPAQFAPGEGISVRPHPHIGIATVTYLFEGEVLHRDSLGTEKLIGPGDLNLMVAGRGIVHSERERPEVHGAPHSLHALQLWLALPDAHEETAPAFHHHPAATLPSVSVEGAAVRVLIGEAFGVRSPVQTFAETLYVEATLEPGQTLRIPDAEERAIYVVSGRVSVAETLVAEHSLAVLTARPDLRVAAEEPARVAILGGAPVGRRFIEWNFVSSRKERIEEAKRLWREDGFPTVPGDGDERIPLPR